MSEGTGQGAVAWLRFYYFRKRVNDFTILGKTRKRFYYLGWVAAMSLLIKCKGTLTRLIPYDTLENVKEPCQNVAEVMTWRTV